MPITDDEVTAIRTMLAGDTAEFQRLNDELDREATKYSYKSLILACFVTAVRRRFGDKTRASNIIEFVGDVRSRLDDPDELDPTIAERLIRNVYRDERTEDIDGKTEVGHEAIMLAAMVSDLDLDDAGLDEFMTESRKLGDQILGG